MLDPSIFIRIPFASADSTNVGRNVGIDGNWRGVYMPASKETRAIVMAERVEQFNAPERWNGAAEQSGLFA